MRHKVKLTLNLFYGWRVAIPRKCWFPNCAAELISLMSLRFGCACFCALVYKLSFRTRSMKSGFMDLVRQSEIIVDVEIHSRQSPPFFIEVTNCHEWQHDAQDADDDLALDLPAGSTMGGLPREVPAWTPGHCSSPAPGQGQGVKTPWEK